MISSAADAPTSVGLLFGGVLDCTLNLLLALGEHRFGLLDIAQAPRAWPLPRHPLPVMPSGACALIGSDWTRDARRRGLDVAGSVIPGLRRSFDRVIGLDQETSFQLEFPDDVLPALDAVIKPNGVYHDPDLYACSVGARTGNGRWTDGTARRPGAAPGGRRLHLSVPCFVTESWEMRLLSRRRRGQTVAAFARAAAESALAAAARPVSPRRPPPLAAHFMGLLTNVQRAEAVRRIRRSGLPFRGGITGVASQVNALEGDGPSFPTAEQRRSLFDRLKYEGLTAPALPRWQYRLSMHACKAVVSIAGHGEICFRMAEAWAMRRVLVCQDLSHARTLFPFVSGANVVYCRPDLEDLTDILDDIECNFARYVDVAERGHRDWRRWSRTAPDLLRSGFQPLLAQLPRFGS